MAEFEAAPDGFTRRHYEAIAATLRARRPSPYPKGGNVADYCVRNHWTRTCDAFADMLESGNLRFDRARFLKACGVES